MIPSTAIAWTGFAVSYLWLGQMHWERMMLLTPADPDCPFEQGRLRGDLSVRVLRIAFVAFWPFLLLLGALNAWIEDRL